MGKVSFSLKQFSANLLFIWLAVLIYTFNIFYKGFLREDTRQCIFLIAIAYTVVGLFFSLLRPRTAQSTGLVLLQAILKIGGSLRSFLRHFPSHQHLFPTLHAEERKAILFSLVKLFFVPIMLNFLFGNLSTLIGLLRRGSGDALFSLPWFNGYLYFLALPALLLVDTLYFSFGYLIEGDFFRNKVRSVEPTAIGWAVALVCYPPFNGYFTNFVSWHAEDDVLFSTPTFTAIMRCVILLLFGIYLWATLALGTKCSNLTNRGIVTKGPYAIVRHPAYIAKNLSWWLMVLPILSVPVFLGTAAWSFVYFLRAVTEENHLVQDPDYAHYCRRVRYRFIPYVW